MAKDNKRGNNIEVSRWVEILNKVSKDYLDSGDVSFATKEELCETILALQEQHSWHLAEKDKYLRGQDISSSR